MNTDRERAAFEAWADAHFYLQDLGMERGDDGDYEDLDVQLAWEAYQAGRAALQSQDREDDPDTIRALLAERDALREALEGLVSDIESLAAESDGVAGFHLNGDLATWEELMPGGRFVWLEHMDKARAALAQEQGGSDAA